MTGNKQIYVEKFKKHYAQPELLQLKKIHIYANQIFKKKNI